MQVGHLSSFFTRGPGNFSLQPISIELSPDQLVLIIFISRFHSNNEVIESDT